MTATAAQAYDDLCALVVTGWGVTGPIDFEDKPRPDDDPIPPIDTKPWLRVQLRHSDGKQVTLANEIGRRRFRRFGIFTVQVFSPLGTSLAAGQANATLVVDALEGMATPHDVLIRNVRQGETGSDGHWYCVNVYADIEYDIVK